MQARGLSPLIPKLGGVQSRQYEFDGQAGWPPTVDGSEVPQDPDEPVKPWKTSTVPWALQAQTGCFWHELPRNDRRR